jgi:1-acyl-sn-glycerol-3-phosphate acyltransferase
MAKEVEKFIDIEKVIAKKSPKLLKLIPRFLLRYLKRILHEDEINRALAEFGHKKDIEFIGEILKVFSVTYTVEGMEKLQENQRYLFASNHPLGGLDGMILIHAFGCKYPSVKFPVNDILMNLPQFDNVFLPINKHGSQAMENVRRIEEAYASDCQILYFPAGLCSRKQGGKIEDLEWMKNFITKAVKHKRHVVPIFFSGRNSNFFYNLARLRSFFGIKANIEMLFLVDEMFKQKGQKLVVRVGEPINFESFESSRPPQWWANWVKNKAYQLNQN